MDIDERYANGKIYKIVCNETGEIYYGSTIQKYLSSRMNEHRCKKNCVSRQILDRNNYYYELVENYSCNNVYELRLREKWYMLNNDCINKNIPTRISKEWKEDNKDKLIEQRRQDITCDKCGCIVKRYEIKRHQRTKKCLSKIEKLNTKTI
jgi:hypothetical protein